MLRIGPFEIYSVINGTFRLDGGAMFGVVPKVLWSSVAQADQANRIPLATRTLVAVDRTGGRVILVDTGCGTKWKREAAQRHAIVSDSDAVPRFLTTIGLTVDDVTDLVVTHLHFDHNGGLTDWVAEPGGKTKLRYPGARHWIHKGHWQHARNPHVKERPSFIPADFTALADSDKLVLVDGPDPPPPFDGMSWLVTYGHTPYQIHPVFGTADEKLVFAGDLVPTAAHLRPTWVMAYDLLPMTTIDEKRALYERCVEQGWLLAFPHDPHIAAVAVEGTPDRPSVARSVEL
jgi:glyoxylase-like metal-dependent hydrolase (beta-lactamase superfamily II)